MHKLRNECRWDYMANSGVAGSSPAPREWVVQAVEHRESHQPLSLHLFKPRAVTAVRKIKTVNAFGTTQVSLVRIQPAVSAACQHSGHCRPFLANAGGTTSLLRTRSRVRVPSSLPSVVNHKTFGSGVAQQVERVNCFTNPSRQPIQAACKA